MRFEVVWASVLLAFGLFALPALIYGVGIVLLGPYGGEGNAQGGVSVFYRNFFADLAAPSIIAWSIAVGPLLVIALFRLAFIGHRGPDAEPPARRESPPPQARKTAAAPQRAAPRSSPQQSRGGRRVEPRIGGD